MMDRAVDSDPLRVRVLDSGSISFVLLGVLEFPVKLVLQPSAVETPALQSLQFLVATSSALPAALAPIDLSFD
jgi:hypothetical protein